MSSVLQNVVVMDLSQNMTGPLCSMILGEMGANVIKVESPEGDASRKIDETYIKGNPVVN